MEEQKNQNEFEDIRPYTDAEVPKVVERLFDNFLFNLLFKIALKSAKPDWDSREINDRMNSFKRVETIDEFQNLLIEPVRGLIKRTTDGLTYSGLENVSRDENHLFISNHRDIVMDPTIMNYALNDGGYKTTAISTGINLLNIGTVKDLMKLNKILVIKRGRRNISKKTLISQSSFISDYLQNYGSIWLAQAEGRAKDGNDFTDERVIGMLGIARKITGKTLEDTLKEMNIISVSISYEYDPLDIKKAQEIYNKRTKGEHKKWFLEDFLSMRKGIFGYKGRVNVAFGKQITQIESKQGLVAEIDRQIITNYRIWPSNELAAKFLMDRNVSLENADEKKFFERYLRIPDYLKPIFLEMYANPVINKRKYDA